MGKSKIISTFLPENNIMEIVLYIFERYLLNIFKN